MVKKELCNNRFHVLEYDTITSTNTELFKLAEQGADEWTVMVAHEQTAGKGRMGRKFCSPSKSGIYVSLLLRPKMNSEKSIYITVASAVAVAQALDKISGKSVGIKWVNDLFVQGKKICGILAESKISQDSSGMEFVILGVGVNLVEPQGGFPEDIKDIAGALLDSDFEIDKKVEVFLGTFLESFYKFYQEGLDTSFEEYKNRSILIGRKVQLIDDDNIRTGCVLDIDNQCGLVVQYVDGTIETHRWGSMRIKVLND